MHENVVKHEERLMQEDSDTSQRDKKTLNYIVAIIGFGLCRAWIVFCLAATFLNSQMQGVNWLYLVSGAVAALFIAFSIKHLKNRVSHIRKTLYIATALCLLVAVVTIPFGLNEEKHILIFAGFVVGGIGSGMLQVLWGDRFALFEVRFATIASPAAAIVTALVVAFSTSFSSWIGYVGFPLLSFALLLIMAQRTGLNIKQLLKPRTSDILEADAMLIKKKQLDYGLYIREHQKNQEEQNEDYNEKRSFGMDVGKLMFSIMLFSFLCRLFDAAPLEGSDPFAFFGGSPLFSLVVVGVAFLLFSFILKNHFNPTLTYRLSLPIMVTGFVAVALFFDTHAALSLLLINIGYEVFDILAWILFTEVSRRKTENSLRIFGLGVGFMHIGMSLGLLGGELVTTLIASGSVQITAIAMLSVLSLVIVAFLVIPEGTIENLAHAVRSDKKRSIESTSQESPLLEGRIESSCVLVSEHFHLTPRESEVLVLLAYGRTLAIIARDLQIAKGTARTHIENIYRKLDVHKQQELIDLVEAYETF